MDFISAWQIYVVIGLAFVIAEAFISSFFLLPFGAAALVTAAFAPFCSFDLELVIFAVFTVAFYFVSLKYLKPHFTPKRFLTGSDSLIGQVTIARAEINDEGQGFIKIYADTWTALPSQTGQEIPKDTKVKVDRVDGNKVFVSKAEKTNS